MKKTTFILVVFFIQITTLWSQEIVEIDKKYFKFSGTGDPSEFKPAWKDLKIGMELYSEQTKGSYIQCLEFLLNAHKFNNDYPELNYMIGASYVASNKKKEALPYLEKAFSSKPDVTTDVAYLMGISYQFNYEFDKAIVSYKKYKSTMSTYSEDDKINAINQKLRECEVGKKLQANPVRVIIENVGAAINSSYSEYSPLITADESQMYFTSRRAGSTGGNTDERNLFFEDIYSSANKNDKWQPAINVGGPLNQNEHDATVGLSFDGQMLFTFKDGDLFFSRLKGDKWTSPDRLPKVINSDGHEESAALSPDGKTLYFSSTRTKDENGNEVGYGEHDIYVSKLSKKGKWGPAKNLGKPLNTAFDDRSVFLHPDGRTIYFSSNGRDGLGGYDIYRSVMNDDGTWGEPENLGYPINTTGDDIFFVLSASGKHAYYSTSQHPDGFGDQDIYRITYLSPERWMMSNEDNLIASIASPIRDRVLANTVQIKKIRLTILKGTITDALTNEVVEASIDIVDNEKNEVISTQLSNSSTGRYLVTLPSGKNYGIAVRAEGYLFHSENFVIPQATDYQEITKDVQLLSVKPGSKVILKNIFFNTAKWDLLPESYAELDRLSELLNKHGLMRIEISGHTDNQGGYEYNVGLSKNRAKAVVDYLVNNKGISADRLTFAGYADTQPVDTNATNEGRQQNRRVEFKVLSIQ